VYALVLSLLAGTSAAATTVIVNVYRDHFEMNGRVLASVDEVREQTRGLESLGYSVRECGAEARVREFVLMLSERAQGRPVNVLREGFPLKCAGNPP
jgi:hypothetical protein